MISTIIKIHYNCLAILNGFQKTNPDNIKKDSSAISVKYFKENIKERYEGSDFNYSINDTDGVNLVQVIFKKFFRWLGDIFGFDIDVNYELLEYTVYALLAIGALYLIVRFLLQSPISSVFRNETRTVNTLNFTEETLTVTNFDKLIKKALKNKDYRLATRYLYLKSLQVLSKSDIIKWNYDKTNSEYINEIKDNNTRALFKRASYIYDYIWYGEFPIDETNYNHNVSVFNQLNGAKNNG